MTSIAVYPALTETGWTTSSLEVANKILSDMFESDYSQTYIYTGGVTSLAWIMQQTEGRIYEAIGLLNQSLLNYFNKYFRSVKVDVIETPGSISHLIELNVHVTFADKEGIIYNLGRILKMDNLEVVNIVRINNGVLAQ